MSTAATIVVNIEGNAAGANRALKSASVEMKFFQDAMRATGLGTVSLGTMIGTFATGAVRDAIGWVKDLGTGFIQMVGDQAEEVDKLGKLADRLGLSTESMAGLEHAAALSNISLEDLGGGLTRLNKLLGEARSGNKDAAKTFADLGLNVADLSGMSLDQILLEISDAMQGVRHDSDKTRLAMELFGRGGAPMLTMLKDGAKGLSAAMKEAKEFGLTFSEADFMMVEQMNDNFERLGRLFTGIARQAAIEFAPLISAVTAELVAAGKDGQISFEGMADGVLAVGSAIENVSVAVLDLAKNLTLLDEVTGRQSIGLKELNDQLFAIAMLNPATALAAEQFKARPGGIVDRIQQEKDAARDAAEFDAINKQILREFKERQAAEAAAAAATKAKTEAEWGMYDSLVAATEASDQRFAEQIAADIMKDKGPALTQLAGTQLGSREDLLAQTQFERSQLLGGAVGQSKDERIEAALEKAYKSQEEHKELTRQVRDAMKKIAEDEGEDL